MRFYIIWELGCPEAGYSDIKNYLYDTGLYLKVLKS